ncbi:MAG TPA: flagellar basal body P-ring formation chaperone FlgA [Spirochaetota bacterium]|nr:flagellar basal body P-ring formation chaperone FlgA [Spirochaetota bacterium]
MKRLIFSLVLALSVFNGAELYAAVRVYMLPEAVISGNDVYVRDICKIEGTDSAKYLELAIPAADFGDNIIDRAELERFMKSCFNETVSVFGNGTMITWNIEQDVKNEINKNRVVKRGDSVQVVVNSGNITIRLTGRSLSDGAVNDEVEVKLAGGKKIRCIVTGERQARMI